VPPLKLSPTGTGRRYGYLKDSPDHRDLGASNLSLTVSGRLYPAVDLESFCGDVRDQGAEGSCTAHAGVGMREFLAHKYENQYPILSPAFLYYQERLLDGTLDQGDCGSYGRTVCRALNQFGCCRLAEERYVPGDFSMAPTPEQLAEGLKWKAGAYHRIQNVQDMRSCLASGYVFCIGFTVYESFEHIGSNGLWSPSKSEQILGGHEVLAIGYDDTVNGGSFKVRNSWGIKWAQGGNFWFRYVDAADPDILQDAWIQHLGRAW
jgi:hypothetical protein